MSNPSLGGLSRSQPADRWPEAHARKVLHIEDDKHDYIWNRLVQDGHIKVVDGMVEYSRIQHGLTNDALRAVGRYKREARGPQAAAQELPSTYKNLAYLCSKTSCILPTMEWFVAEFNIPRMTDPRDELGYSWPHFDMHFTKNNSAIRAKDREFRSAAASADSVAAASAETEDRERANALADARSAETERVRAGVVAAEAARAAEFQKQLRS